MASLGASAAIVNITAGLGEFLGYALRLPGIPPPQAALFGDRFAKKHVALRLALRSVDAGRSSGRG
jgi:hypothetical protein